MRRGGRNREVGGGGEAGIEGEGKWGEARGKGGRRWRGIGCDGEGSGRSK